MVAEKSLMENIAYGRMEGHTDRQTDGQGKNSLSTSSSKRVVCVCNKPFENLVGKGENASNHNFSPFPTIFSTLSKTNFLNYVINTVYTHYLQITFLEFTDILKRNSSPEFRI